MASDFPFLGAELASPLVVEFSRPNLSSVIGSSRVLQVEVFQLHLSRLGPMATSTTPQPYTGWWPSCWRKAGDGDFLRAVAEAVAAPDAARQVCCGVAACRRFSRHCAMSPSVAALRDEDCQADRNLVRDRLLIRSGPRSPLSQKEVAPFNCSAVACCIARRHFTVTTS
jgi:hypothetical protein